MAEMAERPERGQEREREREREALHTGRNKHKDVNNKNNSAWPPHNGRRRGR